MATERVRVVARFTNVHNVKKGAKYETTYFMLG